jgi:transcriptional regulator with XRE-family HTH domain
MSRPKGIPAWNKGMKEQAEIDEINLAYDLAEMVIDARIKKGLTQQELANLSGMLQPAIARIESGEGIPSLSSLQKIAKALGTKLIAPKFEMLVEEIDFSYLAETSIQKDIKEAAIPLYLRFFQFESNNNTKKAEEPHFALAGGING